MKGVILAGGLGSRLRPCTQVTNKHLLPVYDRPMIYYPIQTLLDAGVDDILLVTGGEHAGDFLKLLGNGKSLGIHELSYTYQEGEGGIADALSLAQDYAEGGRLIVMLGDNIVEKSIREPVDRYRNQASGAKILLKRVPDPERFGVARVDHNGTVLEIIEKPKSPPSDLAVTGIYMYDQTVFEMISQIEPSARGELEITDVNNLYLNRGDLTSDELHGWWTDAGTFESLHRATHLVREQRMSGTTNEVLSPVMKIGVSHGSKGRLSATI